jgi:hypothetical protein
MPGRIWEQAFDVATDQYGFIAFADIRRLEADPARLRRWHNADKIDRIGHGIYRFRQIPTPKRWRTICTALRKSRTRRDLLARRHSRRFAGSLHRTRNQCVGAGPPREAGDRKGATSRTCA